MPRKPRPPQYGHHRSSGQARCRIDGRDVYLGKYGSKESRDAYRKILDEWERRRPDDDGSGLPVTSPYPSPRPTAFTVASLLLMFDDHAKTKYSADRCRRFARASGQVKALFPNTPAATFDLTALESVRAAMVRLGWARTYINSLTTCIKGIWKWAASRKLIPVETYQQLALLEGIKANTRGVTETAPIEPVSFKHVEKTLPFLTVPVAAMIRLQMLTGARPGEIRVLRPADIDRTGSVWIYRLGKHKNAHRGQKRTIYFGPKAQEILLPFLDRDPAAYCFSPKDALRGKRGGGRSSLRDCYDGMTYPRAIARAAKKAGVPAWHPNQVRHSVATNIRAEHGPDAARAVLGQKSLQATMIYAELDHSKAEQIMGKTG